MKQCPYNANLLALFCPARSTYRKNLQILTDILPSTAR